MRRREFIALLGSIAFIRPRAARAQHAERMRHVGVLLGSEASADDPATREFLAEFGRAMKAAGWVEGKTVGFDYRFGGEITKITASAAELITLGPDLIYAQGLPAAQTLHRMTKTIPIVFTQVADPVGFGLVDSIGHPGGNMTGFVVWDLTIGGKWLQLLREVAPDLRRVGIIYNPDTAAYAPPLVAAAKVAAAGAVEIIEYPTRSDSDIEAAASTLGKEPHGGLIVIPGSFTVSHRDQIIAQSARFKLATINTVPGAAERGALVSYTYDFAAIVGEPVAYIDRILKGDSPSDLPVQAPTKYVLTINLKTAKALGITVPQTLLVAADAVIE